ncbi:MAG: dihydrolipoyl dehydrogenase [Planctomycetia bacterium]|nr:dihydrolipoyl dehydrogenase [Planctomycetia bacterium]
MYDIIIIGGGPGGYTAAIRAAQLEKKVLLIEREELGGTCLNCGCIPTKMLVHQADLLRSLSSLENANISIDADSIRFDLSGAIDRKNDQIEKMRQGILALLIGNRIEFLKGEASIKAEGKVRVRSPESDQILESKAIILATGSSNIPISVPGAAPDLFLDSTALLNLRDVPRQLTIIGGGVIGAEFASIYRTFGSEVTIIEAQDRLLPMLDSDLGKRIAVYFKKRGIKVHLSSRLVKAESVQGTASLYLETSKGETVLQAEKILISVGRRPNLEPLDLIIPAIKMNGRFLYVDENYKTTVPGLYAIGDLLGRGMLAHLAAEEGKVVVERLAGLRSKVSYHAIPSCVFSSPEIASVGLSEDQAKAKGIEYRTGRFLFAANGKAQTMGETDGFIKILAGPDDTILGVHIIGPHASDLILEGTVFVEKRMKLKDVLSIVHPHPTLGEVFAEALLDIRKESIHSIPAARR